MLPQNISKKKFIITIDTEGDNLWNWNRKDIIGTENSLYLPKFQKLCDEYGFKPVWLLNYEMVSDSRCSEFVAKVVEDGRGEAGIHLHAWNSPPEYQLNVGEYKGLPYLIEYPTDIMDQKIAYLKELITDRIGVVPISHRAGRWATDQRYFDLLIKQGIKIDCSFTPGISWKSNKGASENSVGSDYTGESEFAHKIFSRDCNDYLLEVPVTVKKVYFSNQISFSSIYNILRGIYHSFNGELRMFRPEINNKNVMLKLIREVKRGNNDYLMFMIHSSELMPGGSPNFRNKSDIKNLYMDLEDIFSVIAGDFEGVTLKEYYERKNNYEKSI